LLFGKPPELVATLHERAAAARTDVIGSSSRRVEIKITDDPSFGSFSTARRNTSRPLLLRGDVSRTDVLKART
jgi:hypothetical protein